MCLIMRALIIKLKYMNFAFIVSLLVCTLPTLKNVLYYFITAFDAKTPADSLIEING